MSIKGWRQLTPVYVYAVIGVFLLLLTSGEEFSWHQNCLLIGLGILSWTFIEYGLHRFVFHYSAHSSFGKKLVYTAHLSHHENPRATNRPFSGFLISAPIATAYLLLALVVTRSWHTASYLLSGVAVGYLCYQWLHFQAHHRRPRFRLFRYLQNYHLLHHDQTPELRFGATSPLLDLIFGTFRPVSKIWLRG